MAAPYEQVGQQFIQYYYSKFDVGDGATRSVGLAPLYDTTNSLLTFEGTQVAGKNAILEKYAALPIRQIQRGITKVDCQPLDASNTSILVTVFGQLKTDDDPVNGFFHSFILRQTPDGQSWFIANEIFRLIIHNL